MSVEGRPPPSPLGLIRQFERELSLQRATLEGELRERLARAKEDADATRAEARERGLIEAERRYRDAVTEAHRQAAATHEAAIAAAAALRREAAPHVDDAVEAMLAAVRPGAREVG